jgi:hypothetical protein
MKQIEVDDEAEECDGCRFPGLELEEYEASPVGRRKEPKRLCELCANTFMGNALEYPEQYDNHDAMQIVAFCTNLLLKRLADIEAKIK